MIPLLIATVSLLAADNPSGPAHWWGPDVEASIARKPERRDAWEAMLKGVEPEHQHGVAYLMADLPVRDLEALAPGVLAVNVELADRVRSEVPWGRSLPDAVFRDAVLPHVSVTEPRDSMRSEFHEKYLPLVRDCKTPGEAALKLNTALFRDYKVTYNTRRLRTDQCSRESIAQGMATCTGLSIMLIEAARAVGIPARLAGIHSWPGRGGNHTWVEIWNDGWHFVGAAEPDSNGLDHAWFVGDASRAVADSPNNAIWAAAYRSTGFHFPLAWNPRARVNAENVTARYTKGAAPTKPRLMVEVRNHGERVKAEVKALALDSGKVLLEGTSLGPQADINLHLSAPASAGDRVMAVARFGDRSSVRFATVAADTVVRLDVDRPPAGDDLKAIVSLLADRFGADESKRERARTLLNDLPFSDALRELAWATYKSSQLHEPLRKEWEEKVTKTADRSSPYLWRSVGNATAKSRGLVIAMHGGGGAPKRVNDSQWKSMFEVYYRDHPEAGDYVYLALRAPNDAWNGFYDDAICPLVERLIRQFVLFGNVDPDRVYILGASHGGYGAFVIGPKIPDRFAAIHASASAPSPGETLGENLRNVRFTFMVGEKDTAYGRAERCQAFAKELAGWKTTLGGFPGEFEWKPGVGHSVPDRDKVADMLRSGSRNPRPNKIVWVQSDEILMHSYWIESPRPVEGARVEASVEDNKVRLKMDKLEKLSLWLDSPLVDLSRPVTIEIEGQPARTVIPRPNLGTFCDGLEKRSDPRLAAPVKIDVDRKP
ncbi:MAG: polyhydroxyalkanoate depolymerase [Planctomycetota bacterium]|nr:polyhydroxyalkanoate depolymerase [Planctomycetota bacterium]